MAELNAGANGRISFTWVDSANVAIPAANVVTATLSLIDRNTDAYIALWNNRNVKNVNGGTILDGGGTIMIPGADNAMVSADPLVASEVHLAVLRWTTASESGNATLPFTVLRVHA